MIVLINAEDIVITNIYVQDIIVYKYIKQILTDFKAKIDSSAKTVGDFNSTFNNHPDRKPVRKYWI